MSWMGKEPLIKNTAFLILMLLASFFLALTAVKARTGSYLYLFFTTLIVWTAYLCAHKVETGCFIDGKEEQKKETNDLENGRELTGLLMGGLILVLGMVIGIPAVASENLPKTFLAASTFFSGYIIAHYSVTKELL